MSDRVLVTGVSGFLGGHTALELLKRGYTVRGSVRDSTRADAVRTSLAAAGAETSRLEVCVLDLLDDEGWQEAIRGCRYLVHVASPFVLKMPKDEQDLIRPAVEGTRRAIQAALSAGVQRVALTSSLAAIDGGHATYDRALSVDDWTKLDGPRVNAYARSKTLAEREAWSLMDRAGARDRLAVINPGTLLGPLLDDDPGTSVGILRQVLKGEMPMLPNLILPFVDVRDVAESHAAVLTAPGAGGRRHILTNRAQSLSEIAAILRSNLPEDSSRVPRIRMPDWAAHLLSFFDSSLRDSRAYLGVRRLYDSSTGNALLQRCPRPIADSVVVTARSLLERGLA